MTYRDLKEELNKLTEEELDQDVTVQQKHIGEFMSVIEIDRVDNSDILDDGHCVLVI